ncbi:MAG: hypothetical protein ACP5JB_07565 [candidate division WOR-3 bacterium]|jgi:hypothetical protein
MCRLGINATLPISHQQLVDNYLIVPVLIFQSPFKSTAVAVDKIFKNPARRKEAQ